MSVRNLVFLASLLGAAGVAGGAFGAHALASAVATWGLSDEAAAQRLATWEIAVRYQMYHALALLAVAWLIQQGGGRAAHLAATLMLIGVLVFSGCLYVYVLTGWSLLGGIVPLGGICLVAGWISLALAAWRGTTKG